MNMILYYVICLPLVLIISYILSIFMVTKSFFFFMMTFVLAITSRIIRKKRITLIQDDMNRDVNKILSSLHDWTDDQVIELLNQPSSNPESAINAWRQATDTSINRYECSEEEAKDIIKLQGTYSLIKAIRTYSVLLSTNSEMQNYIHSSWGELKKTFRENKTSKNDNNDIKNLFVNFTKVIIDSDIASSKDSATSKIK
ncbi:hypothetical protein NX809_07820 [Leuconostoc mesenteroides]|uniref:hypothetical protein n=2 Tax=Leuconostoc mesenteroides TaxID=1245 RepID=UPI00107F3EB6|nr:hypothetical protein [Leuconostoc mesenteroides]TGD33440.1 hypothetical protein EIA53_10715 [Leuconostoc mesenteroides]UVV92207.1 hypothetical protein NX809_07820 [Leuconostoc mesenteroides]